MIDISTVLNNLERFDRHALDDKIDYVTYDRSHDCWLWNKQTLTLYPLVKNEKPSSAQSTTSTRPRLPVSAPNGPHGTSKQNSAYGYSRTRTDSTAWNGPCSPTDNIMPTKTAMA